MADAVEARDGDAFEVPLHDVWRAGLTPRIGPLLAPALSGTWHTRHEDVASALQRLRDPGTVEAPFCAAAARYEYLELDTARALARKCTWALADIGAVEARARLVELASADDDLVAEYSQERLTRWEDEAHRKGVGLRPERPGSERPP